jgi:hypothetical protein
MIHVTSSDTKLVKWNSLFAKNWLKNLLVPLLTWLTPLTMIKKITGMMTSATKDLTNVAVANPIVIEAAVDTTPFFTMKSLKLERISDILYTHFTFFFLQ